MATLRVPPGLAVKGTKLWREVNKDNELSPAELVLLEEACRMADRLDRLNAILVGSDDAWQHIRSLTPDGGVIRVVIDDALSEARQQANVLKQVVAALRLPDARGERPQHRGGARGAYTTAGKAATKRAGGGTVTALDAARRAAAGA